MPPTSSEISDKPLNETVDDDLIEACRQGDVHAWQMVIKKYQRLVYSIPLNYGLSQEDAADITQTAFTIMFESLDNFYKNARLAPWLATVARRHSWRLLEQQRRESIRDDEEMSQLLTTLVDPNSKINMEDWVVLEWLDEGISQLDERCRTLVLQLYFNPEKPSYTELAKQLDMSKDSVGPIRARCLQRLKKLLGERP